MIPLAAAVESTALSFLIAPAGASFQLNAVALSLGTVPAISFASVAVGAATPEMMEQSLSIAYPVFALYCEKLSNTLKEKFRTFSGTAQVAVDVRYSQDRIGGIQTVLSNYAGAICQVFDSSRGDWGNGLFYPGAYDVVFSSVKKGGKGFLQTAKITLIIDVSI